jgi:hypothetical protein
MIFLLTVFTVSLDAYIASLAYNLKRKLSFIELLYAGSFTLLVSIIALTFNEIIRSHIIYIKEIGACVFILLGLKNYYSYFERDKREDEVGSISMLGLGVSVDAGIACLTTELVYPIVLCSILMFLGHFCFLVLGAYTARAVKLVKNLSLLSGLILVFLGIIKLLI